LKVSEAQKLLQPKTLFLKQSMDQNSEIFSMYSNSGKQMNQ